MILTEGLAKEVIREVIKERHVGVIPILETTIHPIFTKPPSVIGVSFTTTEFIPEPTRVESIGVSFTTTEFIPEPTRVESIGVSFTTTIT